MTDSMWNAVVEAAEVRREDSGRVVLPEGKSLTLYAAHGGVSLTVAKVSAARLEGGIVRAQNNKGDLFMVALEDLFAVAVEGGAAAATARKGGLL